MTETTTISSTEAVPAGQQYRPPAVTIRCEKTVGDVHTEATVDIDQGPVDGELIATVVGALLDRLGGDAQVDVISVPTDVTSEGGPR